MSRYVDLEGVSWDGKPISSKIQEVQTKHGYMQGITIGWLWGDNVPHIDLEEYDKQIRADAINDYYRTLNEKIKADTDLKDTIKDIHDRVAQEMYCKGIDDFVHKIKEHHYVLSDVINSTDYGMFTVGIEQIAEELKAGDKE